MHDSLERWRQLGLDEVYEVVRTVIVVKEARTYRIDVMKSYSQRDFRTRCWIETDAILSQRVAEPILERILVEYDLPMALGDDPDAVLVQALDALAEGLHQE